MPTFSDAMRANADFLGMAAGRHHQLALAASLRLASGEKFGPDSEPSRNARPRARRVRLPSDDHRARGDPPESALRYELDRLDPQGTPGEAAMVLPGLSEADRVARAAVHFDLLVDALQRMSSLGVDLAQLMPPDAFETTATPVPANGKPDSRG